MNNLLTTQFIYRHVVSRSKINIQQLYMVERLMSSKDSSSSSSSDSSDSDSNKSKIINKVKKMKVIERNETEKKETLDLLDNLLTKMNSVHVTTKTMRAVPKKEPKPKPPKEPELEEKLVDAAKKAAAELGGDAEKTETELLNKVFSAGKPTVALEDKEDSQSVKPSELTLDQLFSQMKVERYPKKVTQYIPISRAEKIQQLLIQSKFSRPTRMQKPTISSQSPAPTNLFSGKPLNIFDPVSTLTDSQSLSRWSSLEKKELKTLLTNPPENIFEEMIQWTEKGLLWQFPINNEIGLEEEEKVHFSEHIFLERHLKGWCPKKGPIRYFMDLVCIGLSKNPYMTVDEKKGHILWYKDYFGDKQNLLKEIGAIDEDIIKNTPKQVPA